MTRTEAMQELMKMGWDEVGAEEIVDTAIECGTFDGMTKKELRELSEDYMDR